ncbi:MAG: AbrB/MazE/SpoVT family DNA-binding domain-containing protein [Gemmatimonadetes bacterium]|nr:AbrB/MazE/SpoVT family DNA-binding domain-containing protein [Gemmatimonadota bacterium]
METVTLSQEFEVVIPISVREQLGLTPGQRMRVFSFEGCIEIVPLRPAREYQGMLRGMNPDFERDEDRV